MLHRKLLDHGTIEQEFTCEMFSTTLASLRGHLGIHETQRATKCGAAQDSYQSLLYPAHRRGGALWWRHHQVLRGCRDDPMACRARGAEGSIAGERNSSVGVRFGDAQRVRQEERRLFR